jgi:hypothetical protein
MKTLKSLKTKIKEQRCKDILSNVKKQKRIKELKYRKKDK